MLEKGIWISFFLFVHVIFNLSILRKFFFMDCSCSKDFRKTYIIIYLVSLTFVNSVVIILYINRNQYYINLFSKVISIPLVAASLLNVLFSLQYVKIIEKRECLCVNTPLLMIIRYIASIIPFTNAFFLSILIIISYRYIKRLI